MDQSDIISNYNSENENIIEELDYQILNQTEYGDQKVFKAICDEFCGTVGQESKNELMPEKDDINSMIPEAEEKPIVVETKANNKKEEMIVFNPWSKKYDNNRKYYKPIIFVASLKENRGDMADNIRKKIKTNFYKNLTEFMNAQITEQESKKLNLKFSNWPQIYKENDIKEFNEKFLNMTLREFLLDDSFKYSNKIKPKKKARYIKNYENNKKFLDHFEDKNNKDTKFKIAMFMEMKEIYDEYLESEEFQKSIEALESKRKKPKYITKYIIVAKDFVNHYCSS